MSEVINDEKAAPIPIAGYITDLSDDEVLALKDEDLKRMVRLKKAAEGVKMMVEPKQPDYHVLPPKDMTVYTVEGVSYVGFKTMAAAQSVQAELVRAAESTVRFWSHQEYIDSMESYLSDFAIKQHSAYSPALWAKVKKAAAENKTMKESYEKERDAFSAAEEGAEWIENEVYGRFHLVRERREEMQRRFASFQEYCSLAEGKEEVAWAFLRKAYAIDAETEAFIRDQWAALPQKA